MRTAFSLILTTACLLTGGCAASLTTSADQQNPDNSVELTATATPSNTSDPTAISSQCPCGTATATPNQTNNNTKPRVQQINVGPNPEDVPAGYNPLTGLPVSDPSTLDLPAVLISITNFPPSARPQAGLSFAPWVFEIYIAEGMTRYLATFYGDFPKQGGLTGAGESGTSGQGANATGTNVGPVRSGRLPYIYIRDSFQDSCLVYAGATEQIRARLRGCAMVFGSDSSNINSAMLDVTRLQKIAEENKRPGDSFNYTGNLFSAQTPGQGRAANTINVFYSFLNQSQWKYDGASSMYQKYEDFADGSGKFRPATDRLTGKQLAFSNVIVLFAQHTAIQPYIIDIKLGVGEKGRAVVFRDGQRFDVIWTTVGGEYEQSTGRRRPIRFVDANGKPFALKPGQSWVHVVTVPSEILDKGDATWLVRFYAPAGAK